MLKLALIFYTAIFGLAIFISFYGQLWKYWLPLYDGIKPFSWSAWLEAGGLYRCLEDLLLGLIIGLLITFLSRPLMQISSWGRSLIRDLSPIFKDMNHKQIIALALLSGIAEEALFRSTLQPVLGLIITSILFAILHTGNKLYYAVWSIFALIFALIVGYLMLWRNGLVLTATIHVIVNLCNIKWLSQQNLQNNTRT
jgi:membrane protease YdiL (CAAX protease family)